MNDNYFEIAVNVFNNDFKLNIHFEDSLDNFSEVIFKNVFIGNLKLPSGKIGACDPFDLDSYIPFDQTFPKGSFPVQLSIACLQDDERIGFVRVLFSQKETVKWTLAQKSMSKFEKEKYSVDSGTGGFFDISVKDTLKKIEDDNEDWFEEIEEQMQMNYKDTRSWYVWDIQDLNVFFFSSGFGDGSYKTYIGFDSEEQVTQIFTDFNLFNLIENKV